MASLITMKCECGTQYQARKADVARGWGRSCSRRCASIKRERELDRFGFQRGESGTFHSRMQGLRDERGVQCVGRDSMEAGWDGHKNAI